MKDENYYLEKAPILKAISNLSVPLMIGMSVSVIYNIIDAYFIGRLNNFNMISAVGLVLPLFTILMALGNLLGVGCGAYISRLLGEKNYKMIKSVSAFAFYMSIIFGLISLLLGYLFLDDIVRILGTDSANFLYTREYSLVLIASAPVMILNFSLEQLVRSEGAAKVSMIGIVLSCVINIILDPILILYFHLGVTGAALGTTVANIIAVLYFISYIVRKKSNLTINIKYFTFSRELFVNVFKIGVPVLIFSMFMMVSSLLMNNIAKLYGSDVLAAYAVQFRITQFPEFIAMGFAEGIVPLIAFNYTAKNKERLRQSIIYTVIIIIANSVIVSGLIFIFSNNIMKLFSININVIILGAYIIRVTLISTFVSGLTTLITGIFQGTGKGTESLIMSVVQGVLFIPYLLLGNYFYGFKGLVWALPLTEITTFIIAIILMIFSKKAIFNRSNQMTAKAYLVCKVTTLDI